MTAIHLPVGELQDALARVKASISNEETRYYLCGVNIRPTKGGAIVQSTDGHRLTRVKINADVPAFASVVISRNTVSDIQKHIKRSDRNFTATILLGDEKKILLPRGVELPLQLIEGQAFPDCDRVIPSLDDKTIATVDKKDFLRCVAAVHGFAEGAGHQCLKLTFAGEKLVFTATADGGTAKMEMNCDRGETHDGFAIGFNGRYLTDFAKRIWSDQINIHLSDAGSPTRFSGVGSGDEHETFVLMPMRV